MKNNILNFCFLFVCFFIAFYFLPNHIQLTLKITVAEKDKQDQVGQIFYSTGDRFSGNQRFNFNYNEKPQQTFNITASIPNTVKLEKIRFDPLSTTGQVTLEKITIKVGFKETPIDITQLYNTGNIYAVHAIADLTLINHKLIIDSQGDDPYLVIIKDIQPFISTIEIWKKNAVFSFILAFLGMLLLQFYRFLVTKMTFLAHAPKKLLLIEIQHPQKTLLFSLIFLSLSIISVKSFTSLVAHFHFKRDLSFADYFFTYMTDLSIATLLSIAAIAMAIISQLLDSKKFISFLALFFKILLKQFKNSLNLALIVISMSLIGLAIYYFVSAYVFYEWGGFVESQHLDMMLHAEVDSEITDLIIQWKTFFFVIAFLVILFISAKLLTLLTGTTHLKIIRLLVILFLPLALLAWYPLNSFKFKPSVQSPVLMLKGQSHSSTVPYKILKTIDPTSFELPARVPVPKEYQHFKGAAKNMNLIIVMMESVRQWNVELYGYSRKTMPTFTALAKNSLVFHNAYVNQPRSSKTMESFSLGIYPDPRLEAVSWKHAYLKTTDSFFKRFVDQGYLFYYGTMQKQKTTEGFYQFLKKISGNHLDYITDLTDIRAKRPEVSDFPKERVLTKDLLIWSEQQQQPYVAFMWTQCAHMPYNSPITPFGTATKIDKYDNCLANLDDSIQVLVEGLKKQGKLDNTLIMIAGDHGEALGEHLDWGHGNYLYEHSLRYPALFYNPKIFNQQIDLYQRFQFKDFAATLLYLFDLEGTKPLGQAINIFTKTAMDPIYLSNVYLDYKLGLIFDHFKFVYRPKYNITYLYDLTADPHEEINLIQTKSETEIEALKQKVLEWYQYQVHYIQTFITEF